MTARLFGRPLVVLVIALFLLGIVSDWPLGWTTKFAVDHPLATSLASAILLFFFAAFVFEGWMREREIQEWRRVAQTAYRALSQEAKDTRVKLQLLVDGSDPRESGAHADQGKVVRIQQVLARTDSMEGDSAQDKLRALSQDEEWLSCSLAYLRDMKRDGWTLLTAWAPVMLSVERYAADLSYMSDLNEAVICLQREFGALLRARRQKVVARPIDFLKRWNDVIESSLRLECHLRVGAGYDPETDEMRRARVFWGVRGKADEQP